MNGAEWKGRKPAYRITKAAAEDSTGVIKEGETDSSRAGAHARVAEREKLDLSNSSDVAVWACAVILWKGVCRYAKLPG